MILDGWNYRIEVYKKFSTVDVLRGLPQRETRIEAAWALLEGAFALFRACGLRLDWEVTCEGENKFSLDPGEHVSSSKKKDRALQEVRVVEPVQDEP